MRKLKNKIKEEENKEVTVNNDELKINRRIKFIRNLTNVVFFIVALFNDKPQSLVLIMSILLVLFIAINYFNNKINDFLRRFSIIWILSIIAWPINLIIKYYFGG